ncbi:Transcription factor SOX-10, partial [Marasmius crinis-equi]
MNCFMLFRADYCRKLKGKSRGERGDQLSVGAGSIWKRLTPGEKQPWRDLADLLRKEHKRKYPSFTYSVPRDFDAWTTRRGPSGQAFDGEPTTWDRPLSKRQYTTAPSSSAYNASRGEVMPSSSTSGSYDSYGFPSGGYTPDSSYSIPQGGYLATPSSSTSDNLSLYNFPFVQETSACNGDTAGYSIPVDETASSMDELPYLSNGLPDPVLESDYQFDLKPQTYSLEPQWNLNLSTGYNSDVSGFTNNEEFSNVSDPKTSSWQDGETDGA